MKPTIIIALIAFAQLSATAADLTRQIKIDVEYSQLDPKWFSDLPNETELTIDGTSYEHHPAVLIDPEATRLNPFFLLQAVNREASLTTPVSLTEDPASPSAKCGATVNISAQEKEEVLVIKGTLILRHSIDDGATKAARQFESREILFTKEVASGMTASINIEGGGIVNITATLVDETGRAHK